MTDLRTIKLFLEGFATETSDVLLRQFDAMNRFGKYSDDHEVYSWEVVSESNLADVLFLGQSHQHQNINQINKLILLHNKDESITSKHIVNLELPIATLALMALIKDSLEKEERLQSEESSQQVEIVVEDDEEDDVFDENLPFIEAYLQKYATTDKNHHLQEGDTNVWINRSEGLIYTDCRTLGGLIHELSSFKHPKIIKDKVSPPNDSCSFIYEAVFWSYGLHASLSSAIKEKFGDPSCQVRLKRWPLFGKWETNSKLLLCTTLFTQKFISADDAVIKSGQDKEEIVRFLVAASMAGLPLEYKSVEIGSSAPVQAKKSVAWINNLREKLRMQEYLSSRI
ncbi:MAG: hypothetical protein IK065_06970 [Neisseriaceae bacterium]|nr:hypothetical protein [Neisseriaceae bacterium]